MEICLLEAECGGGDSDSNSTGENTDIPNKSFHVKQSKQRRQQRVCLN